MLFKPFKQKTIHARLAPLAAGWLRVQQAAHQWLVVAQRPLTTGEKVLVYSVFYDAIDLELPRVIASRWVIKGYAISPNGHIYFNPADFLADFSQASLGKQSWFIHEMTHVWQVQHGMRLVRKALLDRRYRYKLNSTKNFMAYGAEQQAQMVQDFFIKRSLGQACHGLAACLPFSRDYSGS